MISQMSILKEPLVFDELSSTNSFVLERVYELDSGTVVMAHRQPCGRGRMDRRWLMQDGDIACSVLIKQSHLPKPVSLLSLIVPLAIIEALQVLGIDAYIKWPNDIIYKNTENKRVSYFDNYLKLAGILIENTIHENCVSASVIGIGLNVVEMQSNYAEVPHRGCVHELIKECTREQVTNALFCALDSHLVSCTIKNYQENLCVRYQEKCMSLGRTLVIEQQGTLLHGIGHSISPDGGLVVMVHDEMITIYGGEVNFCT